MFGTIARTGKTPACFLHVWINLARHLSVLSSVRGLSGKRRGSLLRQVFGQLFPSRVASGVYQT
jgi:hypothetical protein